MALYQPMRYDQPCKFKKVSKEMLHFFPTASDNWSGYAKSGNRGAFRQISGEWTVPFVLPTSYETSSSTWIGIDGLNNSDLIQTGTAHDFKDGKPEYYAWWEILPAAETRISRPVRPGDRMKAVIVKKTRNQWLIVLQNLTRGWTFRTLQTYHGPQESAEWIVEAPQINGVTTRLARLATVRFHNCRVNGRNPKLRVSEGIVMVQNGRVVSIPSRPNARGDGFTVRNLVGRMGSAVKMKQKTRR